MGDPVSYDSGDPDSFGIYVVRVPMDVMQPAGSRLLLEDRFLFWDQEERRWFYPGSHCRYRGQVLGFIGPLSREQFSKV